MIGAGEAAICLAALVLFVAYAVFTSPAVRVAAWAALAAVVVHVLFRGLAGPAAAAVIAGALATAAEMRHRPARS